jgi:hypothetical protein
MRRDESLEGAWGILRYEFGGSRFGDEKSGPRGQLILNPEERIVSIALLRE